MQAPKLAPSRLHSNVEPGSVVEKSNVAPVAVVSARGSLGPIVVSGAVASIVQAYEAAVGSTFPAASTARTWNVCAPSARLEYDCGVAQPLKPAPSRLHWKLEPASVDEKEKLWFAVFESAGGDDVMFVSGGAVSIVQP